MTAASNAIEAERPPRGLVDGFLKQLHDSWFGPTSPIVPAVCRLLVYGYAISLTHNLDRWIASRKSLWYPVSYFELFDVPLFDETVLKLVLAVHVIAAWAAFLGVFYRIAAPIVAVTALYLMGMHNNFGKVDHSQNALMLTLIVLIFARAADVWSFDAWRNGWRPHMTMPLRPEYRWPQQMILLIVVLMYGAAGWSKYDRHGFNWAFSDNLRNLWLTHQFSRKVPTTIGVQLAEYPLVYRWLGFGSLMLELCAPLALLHRWLRALIVPGLMALQFGIYLTMGVVFRAMIPVFLCLLPWGQMALSFTAALKHLQRRLSRSTVRS